MGVYYDTQAIISYLLNEKGIAMKDIWFYGYCQGSFYAVYAATHFHQIGGVIIDRGIPDYFMMAQKTYSVSEVLYSKVFPSGLKDELPLDPLFIEPDVPFITNGMSNIKRLDACIGINIAPFFFMYGSNDMVINYKQVQALIYSYFNGEDLYFDRKTCKFKSLNAKVTRVHNLKIDHFINFMQLEHQSLNELKRFVEDTINDGSERVNYRVLEKGGVSIKF